LIKKLGMFAYWQINHYIHKISLNILWPKVVGADREFAPVVEIRVTAPGAHQDGLQDYWSEVFFLKKLSKLNINTPIAAIAAIYVSKSL
jgi:hypothetical protein